MRTTIRSTSGGTSGGPVTSLMTMLLTGGSTGGGLRQVLSSHYRCTWPHSLRPLFSFWPAQLKYYFIASYYQRIIQTMLDMERMNSSQILIRLVWVILDQSNPINITDYSWTIRTLTQYLKILEVPRLLYLKGKETVDFGGKDRSIQSCLKTFQENTVPKSSHISYWIKRASRLMSFISDPNFPI